MWLELLCPTGGAEVWLGLSLTRGVDVCLELCPTGAEVCLGLCPRGGAEVCIGLCLGLCSTRAAEVCLELAPTGGAEVWLE